MFSVILVIETGLRPVSTEGYKQHITVIPNEVKESSFFILRINDKEMLFIAKLQDIILNHKRLAMFAKAVPPLAYISEIIRIATR